MHESFAESTVLARVYTIVKNSELPAEPAAFVRTLAEQAGDATPVLALLGTHGVAAAIRRVRRCDSNARASWWLLSGRNARRLHRLHARDACALHRRSVSRVSPLFQLSLRAIRATDNRPSRQTSAALDHDRRVRQSSCESLSRPSAPLRERSERSAVGGARAVAIGRGGRLFAREREEGGRSHPQEC